MTKFISTCLTIVAASILLASCGGDSGSSGGRGQVVGNRNTMSYTSPTPYGMVWVPSGVMRMGANDEDIRTANDAKTRTVQMFGFYMDATEVTNSEYRQFTDMIRDSIAHSVLGDFKTNKDGDEYIDYKKKIKWETEDVQDQMSSYMIPAKESVWGKKEFDNMGKLAYTYERFDYDGHVQAGLGARRADFIKKTNIKIYPDTTVWVKMFNHAYNEPIAHQYNWFKAFDNYPVVGVSWNQANAFNHWRTVLWRDHQYSKKQYFESEFRLPTEAEWEWAARGGLAQSPYPWGGPYLVNKKGCFLANFKPNRGNYASDGGLYTTKVTTYHANQYGLYDMAGNVAEWTISPYLTNANGVTADMSPDVRYKANDNDPLYFKRKSVRGGSWKDVAYYLQVSTRDWEFQDTAKAYIGFRSIMPQASSMVTNKRPVAPKN
jgi:formylglycine-generating enzyme